jgi:hypothetical protein
MSPDSARLDISQVTPTLHGQSHPTGDLVYYFINSVVVGHIAFHFSSEI